MVFTSWLFILQSATVFVGLVIGGVILESENHKRIQSRARELLTTTLIIAAGILWFYHNKSTSANTVMPGIQANQQDYNSIAPTETKQYPVMPEIKTVPPFIGKNSQQVKISSGAVHSKYAHQQADSDVRHCLNLSSNATIASCAN